MWVIKYKKMGKVRWWFWCTIAVVIDRFRKGEYHSIELPMAIRNIPMTADGSDEFEYPKDMKFLLAERVTKHNCHEIAYIRK